MIEFFFDCSSPWTYLAFRNLQIMAATINEPIAWRPVLVGGIFNTVNQGIYNAREDMTSPKNLYLLKDLQDSARQAGVSLVFPPKVFPVNSVKAMRGCVWLLSQHSASQSQLLAFIESTFAAYFTRQEDISHDAVLASICREVGIDADAFAEGIAQAVIKDALKANTDEAIARGAFGSPTFFVARDMYFGNDRIDLVRSAVLRGRAA